MKKYFLFLSLIILFNSCVTNYYYIATEGDTPIYDEKCDGCNPVAIVPKGDKAYITYTTKKYRKIKWKNYRGWALNPNYDKISSSASSSSIPNYRTTTTSPGSSGGTVHVKGYTRKDGTYVSPHTRNAPRRK